MKTTMKINLMLVALVMISTAFFVRQASNESTKKGKNPKTMNTYVIEREIPNAGDLNAQDLKGISQKSCAVLKELGPEIEWVQSYVTDTKIFCIYRAESEAILRTHAEKGGFPINAVHKLSAMISPATATAKLEEIKK
jgi:hypothetical protein